MPSPSASCLGPTARDALAVAIACGVLALLFGLAKAVSYANDGRCSRSVVLLMTANASCLLTMLLAAMTIAMRRSTLGKPLCILSALIVAFTLINTFVR